MNVIEELKNIPGMEPIVELIQTVLDLDENALNEESVKLIKDSIIDSIYGEGRGFIMRSVHNAYRQNGSSIGQVKTEARSLSEAFAQIKNGLDVENKYKKEIIDLTFDEISKLVNEAAEEYFTEDVQIFIQKVHENAQVPTYADFGSSGADVYATEDITIAKSTRGKIVKTGLKMAIPLGWELQVRPRSGLSVKTAMRIANAPGTIDAGYPDEVGIIIDNLSSKDIEIHAGDRIAQFVVAPVYKAKFTVIDNVAPLNDWSARHGGFGSTGA